MLTRFSQSQVVAASHSRPASTHLWESESLHQSDQRKISKRPKTTDDKVNTLHAKLDMIASRLQAVDARSDMIERMISTPIDKSAVDPLSRASTSTPQGSSMQHRRSHAEEGGAEVGTSLSRTWSDKGHEGYETDGHRAQVPRVLTNLLEKIQGSLIDLDYIFIKALGLRCQCINDVMRQATASEHEAATKIAKTVKGFLRRKRYLNGILALKMYQERQSSGLAKFFDGFLQSRRAIRFQLNQIIRKRELESCRKIFRALFDYVLERMPLRSSQRQKAFFMIVKYERRLVYNIFQDWRKAMRIVQELSKVASKNNSRLEKIHSEVSKQAMQEGWREDVIESVVQQRMYEDSIALMSGRMGEIAVEKAVKVWRAYLMVRRKKRTKFMRAIRLDNSKRGWEAFSSWKEYIKECKRWDAGKYVRLRNERHIQHQAIMSLYSSHMRVWLFFASKRAEVKKRFKLCLDRLLRDVMHSWFERARFSRSTKIAVLEKWILVSKSMLQFPFRSWYLWTANSISKRQAQGMIADMLSRRWMKIRLVNILQAWWQRTDSGMEAGQGREELFTLLHEQQQINKDLEETVSHYKDLHNKSELGLRKHEDLLVKREKQILKLENERTELMMKIQASELEISRLQEMQDKKLSTSLIRKAQKLEASGILVLEEEQPTGKEEGPASSAGSGGAAAELSSLADTLIVGGHQTVVKVEKASVGSRTREREKGGKKEKETGDVQQQAIKNEEVEDRNSRGEGGKAAKDGDRQELKPAAALPVIPGRVWEDNKTEVYVDDNTLLKRAKYIMSTLRDKMSLGDILQVDESSKEILEILQAGTQNGVEVEPSNLDSLNWQQFIVGLDQYDNTTRKKDAGGQDALLSRIMKESEGEEELVGRKMMFVLQVKTSRDIKSVTKIANK
ncbi:hypothetical protein GUITHDRAFT_120953 [Guillardia theta CCMP2712]|uniref:Uncharacterized protein n=1 Tax=Guillardia theta (strain CCMP2712) TaxID=905079 RepID=L1IAD3_GUITC|nr:hypothetical protein GUITHDRAFT_120953 [Guillardia theta CCMP2712]EKX32849.1 hypothetical protein GUITHDRAFT_120953 [Guillardia theta CCMP2712]|eukprot:XP_005819829.1 hypothetical protein GUITHDRAFT_120953 [Guillardia theta CCMP2712]